MARLSQTGPTPRPQVRRIWGPTPRPQVRRIWGPAHEFGQKPIIPKPLERKSGAPNPAPRLQNQVRLIWRPSRQIRCADLPEVGSPESHKSPKNANVFEGPGVPGAPPKSRPKPHSFPELANLRPVFWGNFFGAKLAVQKLLSGEPTSRRWAHLGRPKRETFTKRPCPPNTLRPIPPQTETPGG